ncbi:hydrolase [Bacillus toyonensis]|nr:hydrolase [Bacillus toyonensis]
MRSEGLVGGELISEDILIVDIPKDELTELLRVIERKKANPL